MAIRACSARADDRMVETKDPLTLIVRSGNLAVSHCAEVLFVQRGKCGARGLCLIVTV